MKEISGNIDALNHKPDWRGIDDVMISQFNGVFILKVERRWLDVGRSFVLKVNENQIKYN